MSSPGVSPGEVTGSSFKARSRSRSPRPRTRSRSGSGLQEPRQDEVPHRQPAEPKQEQILQKKVSVSAEILSVPGQKILQVAHSVPGPGRQPASRGRSGQQRQQARPRGVLHEVRAPDRDLDCPQCSLLRLRGVQAQGGRLRGLSGS